MIRREKLSSSWPELRLPKEGVFTENGYFFHHETPKPLKENHTQRLLEYGIQLACWERFTPEEDDRIRENWRSLAQKYGFLSDDAQYYIGYDKGLECVKFRSRLQRKLLEIGFWPQLCRELECRSAMQVKQRMKRLFDPCPIGGPSPLPEDLELKIHELLAQRRSPRRIAETLNIPLYRVRYVMSDNYSRQLRNEGRTAEDEMNDSSTLDRKCLPRDRYHQLFVTVVTKSSLSESRVADYLRTSLKSLKSRLSNFNWHSITPSFRPFQAGELKQEWRNITKQLHKSYLTYLETLDECQAWICAKAEIRSWETVGLYSKRSNNVELRDEATASDTELHSEIPDSRRSPSKAAPVEVVSAQEMQQVSDPIFADRQNQSTVADGSEPINESSQQISDIFGANESNTTLEETHQSPIVMDSIQKVGRDEQGMLDQSFDLFEDAAGEAEDVTRAETSFVRSSVVERRSSSSPTIAVSRAEHRQELNLESPAMEWEDEQDSLRTLRVTLPSRIDNSLQEQPSAETMSQEGWMQFFT
ncbi:unnamed protein product [Nippostrongylus brasiliensis]|uniref:RNA polymerase sigma factor, sigma-70 family n=1 Tax=Nippostrongylus brasiliensis TaxID=27835 RepID=A0A0N4XYN5_NIPBR|nr:unnamed protein product [Nippostrongylus brasiliensis]